MPSRPSTSTTKMSSMSIYRETTPRPCRTASVLRRDEDRPRSAAASPAAFPVALRAPSGAAGDESFLDMNSYFVEGIVPQTAVQSNLGAAEVTIAESFFVERMDQQTWGFRRVCLARGGLR